MTNPDQNPVQTEGSSTALQCISPQTDWLLEVVEFDDEQQQKINQLATTVEFSDTASMMTFGKDIQTNMNGFYQNSLESVRNYQTGDYGEILISPLNGHLKGLNLNALKKGDGFLAKLFNIGKAIVAFKKRVDKILPQIMAIEKNAVELQTQQAKTIKDKDLEFKLQVQTFRDLEIVIAGGQVAIKKAWEQWLQDEEKLKQSKDVLAVQTHNDNLKLMQVFDRQIFALIKFRTQSLASLLEIRAMQQASQTFMELANNVITGIIPQILRMATNAVTFEQQKAASKQLGQANDLMAKLSAQNADAFAETQHLAADSERKTVSEADIIVGNVENMLVELEKVDQKRQETAKLRQAAIQKLQTAESSIKDFVKERTATAASN